MKVTREKILQRLPAYEDKWKLIVDEQYVRDIMNEIMTSHRLFADYYNNFSSLFLCNTLECLTDSLFYFCKENIKYKEETKERQTSALPTGFLHRGYGDCKHYALFSAGVIDSLNRQFNLGIDWWYYFAGYEGATEPYHVFVAVRDGDEEVWIDPTPGAADNYPTLLIKWKP